LYNHRVELRTRDSELADFEGLWSIDQRCFEPGIAYSRRELARYMRQRSAFTIIGETRETSRSRWRMVGFVVGQVVRGKLGHIVTIDVLPEGRRTGIGSRLMSEAEARLRERGCEAIALETAVDNAAAIAFYKRLGFEVIRTIPRYYLGKIDALLMMKPLI
jgi:[ribosomal protein S18]-alanine N-acetyltransferase